MSDNLRYGTVGTSKITDDFIVSARLAGGMELTAVYSRSQEKGLDFSEKYGAKTVFTDLRQMASSELIDAVYIASPNSLHYEQSKLFLEHGKHVLCEKPITVTPAELKELMELARQKDLIYMEAIKMLHLPARLLLKEALGRIGRISTARFDFSQLSSKYPAYLKGEVPNIFNTAFATGCLMDLGIYCVYPALDLFGLPEKITAGAGFLDTGVDGYGSCIFSYPDKQINLSYSKIGQSRLGSEIMGDKGTIVIGSISTLTGMRFIWNNGTEEEIIGNADRHETMSGEIRAFYQFIKDKNSNNKEYRYAGELALKVSEVLEAVRRQADIRFE